MRELIALDLFEVGPCLKGANPATVLVDAKAHLEPEPAPAVAGESLPVGWPAGELSLRLNLVGAPYL